MTGDSLLTRITTEIAVNGPMPFDRFMEVALYDPDGGYFATGPLRSERDGDFLTSPEVSPAFGETLGRFCKDERERVGEQFTIVEAGAGSGTLLRPLLDALGEPFDAYAVEVSPSARLRLSEVVPEVTVVGALSDLPESFAGVVVANELLDNLPAAVVVRRGDSWRERVVSTGTDGGFEYDEAPMRPEVAAWVEMHTPTLPEGSVVEVQVEAAKWLGDVLGRLRRGTVLIIDYGDTTGGLARRRGEGTIRTYRGHHLGPDPLLGPGSTDITMDVDFSALMRVATVHGADVRLHRQDDFLTEWGLRQTLADLRVAELDAARRGDTMRRFVLRSQLTDAETLLHPRGLGDFRVLVVTRS